jgi:hypothetical protein
MADKRAPAFFRKADVELAHPRRRAVWRLAAAAAAAGFGRRAAANASAMATAAQRCPQVGKHCLRPLVEVQDRRWSRPPCHLPPTGGRGNAGWCVQVDVIADAGERVEY